MKNEAILTQQEKLPYGKENLNVESILAQAKLAQDAIKDWSDTKINKIITDINNIIKNNNKEICCKEVAETKIGNFEDKQHKLSMLTDKLYEELINEKTIGLINNPSAHMYEYASPVGIVLGIVPLTNPVTNSLFKTYLSLKTRNALILSFPKRACSLGSEVIAIVQKVLKVYGAPDKLIQFLPANCSHEYIQNLMANEDINLILATGGPRLVKLAYSSGNPTYGVGPGNVPVIVTATAELEQAAIDIIKSKTYDNGIICGSESNLIVEEKIVDEFINILVKHNVAVLNEEEALKAKNTFFDPESGRLKNNFIGITGSQLAKYLNITRLYEINLIVILSTEEDLYLLGTEKMAPLLTLFTINKDKIFTLANKCLEIDGRGHTAVIHSQDMREVNKFAETILAGRLLVNTPATHGMIGETTEIITSFMQGCGTYGKNISTAAITWQHLVNIKRLAFDITKPLPQKTTILEE